MAEAPPLASGDRRRGSVMITGVAAVSAYGRGASTLLDGVLSGRPAFGPVSRFDVRRRRVGVGALLDGSPVLLDELIDVVDQACTVAGLSPAERATCPLLLAVHGDPAVGRVPAPDRAAHRSGLLAATIAQKCGLSSAVRTYTAACVAASTAVADGAAMLARGDADRVVVAAGYLVEPDQFALFDAGRALAVDGAVRPFSRGRKGLLLGDGVAAMMLESSTAADTREAVPLARLAGWGRAGDAYHVCQPRPDGAGMARAIAAALRRAQIGADEVGYVNAHGSGSQQSDVAEAHALLRALGPGGRRVPISSTKALHGQALEASPLLELIVTVLALRKATLPVNAGFLGPDEECPLNLILDHPQPAGPRWALSLNSAFGGANTALLVGDP
jgi:3-oxoacyl-[acyl-carrier-protein] synthase II